MTQRTPPDAHLPPRRLWALALLAFSFVFLGYAVLVEDSSDDDESATEDEAANWLNGLTVVQDEINQNASAPNQPLDTAPSDPTPALTYTIKSGDAMGPILAKHGIKEVNQILSAAKPIQDLSRIRSGQKLIFDYDDSNEPETIRYPIGGDDTLVLTRSPDTGEWTAQTVTREFDVRPSKREITVETTLWGAATNAGLQSGDIVGLANVYKYDVDFNTEVQAGATAEILIDELWENGEFVKLGQPKIARFTNAGESYLAIHYTDSNGKSDYYDETGLARKTAFLRSPLGFQPRVTSSFNPNRFHPIHKTRRPHNGVDFGAPTGTKIKAIGDGKVTFSGRNGGYGKHVKIDHPGPYVSTYSHMNKIMVKRGETVRQGQVIGTVGATGTATGPHLHFEFLVNGVFKDPMKQKHARTQRLPKSEMGRFNAQKEELLSALDGQ